jgi:ankyrin repeat protein
VLDLINHNADVNAVGCHGRTVLLGAALSGHADVVSVLLNEGAKIGRINGSELPLLYVAIEVGNPELIKVALDQPQESNISYRNKSLHKATQLGYVEAVSMLLERGAQMDSIDDDGWTALHMAVNNSQYEVAYMLLDRGANVDAHDTCGQTPLFFAAHESRLISLLLDNGADMHAKGKTGESILQYYTLRDQLNGMLLLLNCGFNIETTDNDGHTALQYAVQKNNLQAAAILLDRGIDPNCFGGRLSVLQSSIEYGFAQMAELLLDWGADCNAEIPFQDGFASCHSNKKRRPNSLVTESRCQS